MEQPQQSLQKVRMIPGNSTIILVFATTIQHPSDISKIKPLLDQHHAILSWNVDLEDWEKILRIKAVGISGEAIAKMISGTGIKIRELK